MPPTHYLIIKQQKMDKTLTIDSIAELVSENKNKDLELVRKDIDYFIRTLQKQAEQKGLKIDDYNCARVYLCESMR